jgi:hypothetical protein
MWPFGKHSRKENIALIDIGSSSVGGGLLHLEDDAQPVMCFTTREPLNVRDAPGPDPLTERMLRALGEVGKRLVTEGAPQLRQASGSGSIDRVLVSISSPWQTSSIATKLIQKDEPFIFTKTIEREALAELPKPDAAQLETQTVITTILNGYSTRNPYGNRAHRAEIILLMSLLEARVVDAVEGRLRRFFHTSDIGYTGFASPTYSVLRQLYPHEKDMLIVSVMGEGTDITSVKRGHLVDVGTFPQGGNTICRAGEEHIWLEGLSKLLREFAGRHALPRLVFLMASEAQAEIMKRQFEDTSLLALWLSDAPLTLVTVKPQQFTPFLKTTGGAEGDLSLGLLALYANQGA